MSKDRLFERMQGLQDDIFARLKASDKRHGGDPYPMIGRKFDNLISFMKSLNIDPDTDENFTVLIDTLGQTVSREKYMGPTAMLVWVLTLLDKHSLYEQMWYVYQHSDAKHQPSLVSFLPPHYQSAAIVMR